MDGGMDGWMNKRAACTSSQDTQDISLDGGYGAVVLDRAFKNFSMDFFCLITTSLSSPRMFISPPLPYLSHSPSLFIIVG